MIYINLVYEDELSEMVMLQLLQQFYTKYSVSNTYPGYGFGYLKKNIRGFNQASAILPFFMLTDLDTYPCPSALIEDWTSFPLNPNIIFRIAVREIESWLLADIEGLSDFLRVPPANFPLQPDSEIDPKKTLIRLAKRSRIRRIREEIVPINNNATIGPNYNMCLSQFVSNTWNINEAMTRSNSLERAYRKLQQFDIKS